MLAALFAWYHRPLLVGVYDFLVVSEPLDGVSAMVIADGDQAVLEAAVDLYRRMPTERVYILDNDQYRAVQIGVVPSLASTVVQQFERQGIPEERLTVVSSRGFALRENLPALERALDERQPSAVVVLLSPASRGRYCRTVLDNSGSPLGARMRVFAVPTTRFDQKRWWTSKSGWRTVADSYFRLCFAWQTRGAAKTSTPWNPDQFEESLP